MSQRPTYAQVLLAPSPPPMCRRYEAGFCRFGSTCRFRHQDSSENGAALTGTRPPPSTPVPMAPPITLPILTDDGDVYDTNTQMNFDGDSEFRIEFAPVPRRLRSQRTNEAAIISTRETNSNDSTDTLDPNLGHLTLSPDALLMYRRSLSRALSSPIAADTGNSLVVTRSRSEGVNTFTIRGIRRTRNHSNIYMDVTEEENSDSPSVSAQTSINSTDSFATNEQSTGNGDQNEPIESDFEKVVDEEARQRSVGKMCGICFDIVIEKLPRKRHFGILSNCFHVFCFECISRWRRTTEFRSNLTRSCPECRISSDCVLACPYWLENREQKDKFFNDYRATRAIIDCKYFKKGKGICQLGNQCFYKHALPNGELIDLGNPLGRRAVIRENLVEHFRTVWGYDMDAYDVIDISYIDSDSDDDLEERINYLQSIAAIPTNSGDSVSGAGSSSGNIIGDTSASSSGDGSGNIIGDTSASGSRDGSDNGTQPQ